MKIKDIIGEDIAVHCDTYDKAEKFLNACEKLDIKWINGDSATIDYGYDDYGINTCYHILDVGLSYCFLGFYESKDFIIINFDDLKLEE